MVYKWKYGQKVDPNIAGQEFERISEENGMLTPSLIVESARGEQSPLRKCFEWDDRIAGEKYREHQASDMIRALVVVNPLENEDSEASPVRAFVNVSNQDDERGFVAIQVAMTNEDFRGQVLRNALAELKAFQDKYRELVELTKVFSAIDSVMPR